MSLTDTQPAAETGTDSWLDFINEEAKKPLPEATKNVS